MFTVEFSSKSVLVLPLCPHIEVLKERLILGNNFRNENNTGLFISPSNMLENWLMPQSNEDINDYTFQQDGSAAHYKDVRGYLNRNFPQRWIGRTGKEDALMRWPPRSPDLTPCDFFFRGVCEGHCLCASTPPQISRFPQPYHRCCYYGRPWYAETRVERDGLSNRRLPYYRRWTNWTSVKCVKKTNLESFSLYRRKNYHYTLSSLFVANF